MNVLGIETSCDETAAAVVGSDGVVRSSLIYSQLTDHQAYGGVVPEIAARAHVEHLDGLVRGALDQADLALGDVDAIAATAGPGLIGGVLVGLVTGKALAMAAGKPLIAVNHLEGHALSARLSDHIEFPFLVLLVTGGHCQLVEAVSLGHYELLGTTIDDAVGEAFDKAARLMGFGYPGGPEIEKAARDGDPNRFPLPRPMAGRPGCDFSFSGLKTAVRRTVEQAEPMDDQSIKDLAASFQSAVGDALADRTLHAMEIFTDRHGGPHQLVIAGGVAANGALAERLGDLAEAQGFSLTVPPMELCPDNAAMIAWAGVERLQAGLTDDLDFLARARWPLDELPGPPASVVG
ncbi:MAG: tRNA (adenosine(37)-N6)-threonylcarbamoyltransferase complex transferase subunit TsaD [Alphaproteobacteria bacterium]|nr:tRNA (adenosine(37)-N6)-threonylcarbamoyltransferase complex transferase subunit TsaD [Alphaproteobacteria bacterium]